SSLWEGVVARPEPGATDFVRIGFARDCVGQPGDPAGMERGPPSGETGDRKVETAPEKMDGTRLAQKTAAEELKHTIDLNERPPEGMGCLGVVGRMGTVIGKPDRVRHLVRH